MRIPKGKKPYTSSNQSAQCDESLILSPLEQTGRASSYAGKSDPNPSYFQTCD